MRYGPRFPTILIFVLAGVYGCGDDVTDPDAFLESAEAEAVMRSARQLPALPDLMAQAAPESDRDRAVLLRARELWAAGSLDDGRADSRRRLAVGYALPVLVESVSAEEWTAVREGMDDWIATVQPMLQRLALPQVQERITAARNHMARSDASRDDQRRRSYYLLLAMSELVETTPRFVARSLVADAAGALERQAAGGDDEPSRTVKRARRLKDWAERAVAEEDYLLAIQRAYYAIQLVEGS